MKVTTPWIQWQHLVVEISILIGQSDNLDSAVVEKFNDFMNSIHSGSGGNTQYFPLRQGVYSGWYYAVSHRILLGVFDDLKLLQLPVRPVQLSPLWPIMICQQTWILSSYLWMSQQESYHSWVRLCKDKKTGQASILSLSQSRCSLRWGCAHLLHLGSFFIHQQLVPWMFRPSAFQSLFQDYLWIDSSPQTWDDWTIASTLSQVPVKVQIPVQLDCLGRVDSSGHRWTAASLQFARVSKSPWFYQCSSHLPSLSHNHGTWNDLPELGLPMPRILASLPVLLPLQHSHKSYQLIIKKTDELGLWF